MLMLQHVVHVYVLSPHSLCTWQVCTMIFRKPVASATAALNREAVKAVRVRALPTDWTLADVSSDNCTYEVQAKRRKKTGSGLC
jgi:hypothetical protein